MKYDELLRVTLLAAGARADEEDSSMPKLPSTVQTDSRKLEVIPWGDRSHASVSLKFPLLDSAGVPYAVGGVSTDITLLKEAQRRAVQAERLAAIGQMAAGLAHEGRNALQRSQICLELLTRQLGLETGTQLGHLNGKTH